MEYNRSCFRQAEKLLRETRVYLSPHAVRLACDRLLLLLVSERTSPTAGPVRRNRFAVLLTDTNAW